MHAQEARLDVAFRVNSPSVVAEIIDGEAMMMNLATGNYFSAADTGCLIWTWIEEGAGTRDITQRLAAMFDASEAALTTALDVFIADLLSNELIVKTENPSSDAAEPAVPSSGRGAFMPPVLSVYTDMRDLLLLDPIDDVDEVGWPTAPRTAPDPAAQPPR